MWAQELQRRIRRIETIKEIQVNVFRAFDLVLEFSLLSRFKNSRGYRERCRARDIRHVCSVSTIFHVVN